MRLRWLSGLRPVVGVLVLVFVVAGLTVRAEGEVGAFAAGLSAAVDPPDFLLVTQRGSGIGSQVEQRSPVTGAVVDVLGPFGAAFTNNGLTQSHDGRQVYVTFIARRTLKIERIDVATGSSTFVADGERPSVSPDGKQLAYGSGPFGSEVLSVRELASGATRTIDLRRFLGRSYDLLGATITWLADQSAVVVMPAPVAVAVGVRSKSGAPRTPGSCGAHAARACVIVVSVGHARSLTAYRIDLPGPVRFPSLIEGDGARPRSVFIGTVTDRGSVVQRLDLIGSRAKLVPLFSLPNGLVLTFDRSGRQLLYLVGHSPPALWTADVASGQPTDQRLLMPAAELQAAAW